MSQITPQTPAMQAAAPLLGELGQLVQLAPQQFGVSLGRHAPLSSCVPGTQTKSQSPSVQTGVAFGEAFAFGIAEQG